MKSKTFLRRTLGIAAAAVLAFALLGLAGCGSSSESSSSSAATTSEAKDTYVFGAGNDPGNTLNYFTADDRTSLSIIKAINDPLYSVMSDGSYYYYAAKSVEPSEDGLTYTVVLKDGVQWSDGEPLTADDVVFTYEKFMAQDEGGTFEVDGKPVEVAKVDDVTVTFTLPSPVASMPENISMVFLLPKHVFDGKDNFDMDLTSDTIVGCGPYMFDSIQAGEYVTVKANPNYMSGEANIKEVTFRFITNSDTAKAALQKGEIDSYAMLPAELDGMDSFTISPYSEGRVAYLRANTASENMKDKDYRKGIFMALNKKDIMTAAYKSLDYVTISDTFLPAINPYYTDNVEKYEQNVDEAKELVKGGPTSLKLCYIADDAPQTAQAQMVQSYLKEIGIDVQLEGVDTQAYMASANDPKSSKYDMYLGGYILTIDPDGFKGYYSTGGRLGFDNKEIDKLFEEGMTTTKDVERVKIYEEAQQLVADEAILYPFGSNLRILVSNPNLQGLEEAKFAPVYTFEDMSKLYFD